MTTTFTPSIANQSAVRKPLVMRTKRWTRMGRIICPDGVLPWMRTHTAVPFAQHVRGNVFRIYFTGRDDRQRSQIGCCEVDIRRPHEIIDVSDEPLVAVGPRGAFDDSGATMSCVVSHAGMHYLYYTGWNLGVTVPFYFSVGLARSLDNGKSFRKLSEAPLLDRHPVDPYLVASPFVMIEDGMWRMWYISGQRWDLHDGEPRHYYHIRYASSHDGLNWKRSGLVCIDFKNGQEYAIGRPTVLRDDDRYRMWYPYRGDSYRIGYAESEDGLNWKRMDGAAGLEPSEVGWDSEMLCYPHVFKHDGRRYMLYNGNDYGATGIGLAVWE